MNKKQVPLTLIALAGLLLLVAVGGYAYYRSAERGDTRMTAERTPVPSGDAARECLDALARQRAYLDAERLSAAETFAKYPAQASLSGAPAALKTEGNRFASEFQTRIREEMARDGVNFAGHYSLIGVGMTGWGTNYFIVDRRDGQAYLFPYYAAGLEFRKDSNLIVMNPKEKIAELTHPDPADPLTGCYYLGQQRSTDLRPFYFEWRDNDLVFIGPRELTPPLNAFWKDYFGPAASADTLTLEAALDLLEGRIFDGRVFGECKASGIRGEYVSCSADIKKEGDKWIVTATYQGLYDDSVGAARVRAEITRKDGNWTVGAVTRTYSCQPGRGHQDFSSELCV